MSPVRRHRHTFTALYYHYGPFGPQDVHIHACPDWPRDAPECDRVLIGAGRDCSGDKADHRRETLGK